MKKLITLLLALMIAAHFPRQLPPHRCLPGEDCRPCAVGENCYIPPGCRIGEQCNDITQ